MGRLAAFAAALLALVAPASARAATVYEPFSAQSGLHGDLVFQAAPGEVNYATVSVGNGKYSVEDTGAPLTAGENCVQVDAHHATCEEFNEYGEGLASPKIFLDDESDTLFLQGIPPCPLECEATGLGAYTAYGGTGNDTLLLQMPLAYASTNSHLYGDEGDDIVVGSPNGDTLNGGPGDDALRGGRGADFISGGPGSDRFVAESTFDHSDTMVAGDDRTDGIDTLDYSARGTAALDVALDTASADGHVNVGVEHDVLRGGFDNVRAGAGPDVVAGNELANRLEGGNGTDTLIAGEGADIVAGGGGNDRLLGGEGPDVLQGNAGTDTADYSGRFGGVTVKINNLTDDGNALDGPVGARDDVRTDVENLIGTSDDDTLEGSGLANVLDGGLGADTLRGLGGVDTASYATRTTGVTVSIDGAANDGNADDGPAGARDNVATDVENLAGGSGNDTLDGSRVGNLLDGGGGADVLRGFGGADTATYANRSSGVAVRLNALPDDGNAQDGPVGARDDVEPDVENVLGGSGPDTIFGSNGPNRLLGGKGADKLRGLGGNDTIVAKDGAADDIRCGLGVDSLTADSGIDAYPTAGDDACENVN